MAKTKTKTTETQNVVASPKKIPVSGLAALIAGLLALIAGVVAWIVAGTKNFVDDDNKPGK
jgi:hypothetical protein